MISVLKQSFRIDMATSINSILFLLKKTPIIKSFLPDSLYQNQGLKIIATFFALIYTFFKVIFTKGLYFFGVYKLSELVSTNKLSFVTLFFFLTCLGAIINSRLLGASKKKYYSIILMNMDAKKYTLAYLFSNEVISFIINLIGLTITCLIAKIPMIYAILLTCFLVLIKIIGEAYNIWFFQKFKYTAINNYKHYFIVSGIFITLGFLLPYLHINITANILIVINIIILLLAILALYYIRSIKDYKVIHKRLNNKLTSTTEEQTSAYNRQMMVQVKDQDKEIDQRKLKNKKGYDRFNTIFFERHKYLLLNSAIKYALIIAGLFTILAFVITFVPEIKGSTTEVIDKKFSWIVMLMYFINRGAIITQAMFFNCDHAMLKFNFYRDKRVILSLFKERLKTVVKVNLIPSSVLSIGIVAIFLLCGKDYGLADYIAIILAINAINIFFSVHYLVIYYLLQPYNQDLQMKSVSYGIVTTVTYILAYNIANIKISFVWFSVVALIFAILYIIISLILVYKKAETTFKMR